MHSTHEKDIKRYFPFWYFWYVFKIRLFPVKKYSTSHITRHKSSMSPVYNKTEDRNKNIEYYHESKRFKCNQCDFRTGHANSLRRHIRITHEGQKFECLLCGCQMGDISNLQRHIKRNHKSLNNHGSLKKYIKYVQDQVEAIECSICEYTTTKKSSLKTHLKSNHDVEVN